MGFTSIPAPAPAAAAPPAPTASFIPSPSAPAGLTLRNTYTTSQTGLTFAGQQWVYVVAVGGGGSGCAIGAIGGGGGGGACIQGWVKAVDLTSVTIGAGGATVTNVNTGNSGSPTIAGPIRAPGGGSGATAPLAANNAVEPGAGGGGVAANTTYTSVHTVVGSHTGDTAYGLFRGGYSTQTNTSKPLTATSGAGGFSNSPGGDGFQGPAGGGGTTSATIAAGGGSSPSPNGTTYAGGANAAGAEAAGGGAGILAAGSAGVAATKGGDGGLGGGGGGAVWSTTIPSGKGGDGAVLIYY